MEKISVIVPVYQVETYLDRCVESIVHQTYKNLEIILVDDGSPDRCGAMCDAWAEKDSRVRVIHKENGGLSDARNAGMSVATGELMGFIDSDDWIEPNMYELLREHMQRDGADISACGVVMDWEDGTPSRPLTREGARVLSGEEAMRACIEESWLKQPVWYKLYKTALIREIPFAVGKCHEDVFWTYQAVGTAKKVSVFDAPCYHYLQRSGSIMGAQFSMKRLDALEARKQQIGYMKNSFPLLAGAVQKCLFGNCFYLGQLALKAEDRAIGREAIIKIASVYREERRELLFRPSVKNRIWLALADVDLKLCCQIRNALDIGG